MRKRLPRSFYTCPTESVARELLGKHLVRKEGSRTQEGMITEVEMYCGPRDLASHAAGGKRTPRNEAEWMEGGHVYIYLVYGMHWQLNISTYKEGTPECVLIRALDTRETSGPGKLCREFELDGTFYGENVTKSERLWLEDRGMRGKVKATARIGIDYAGPFWARRKWRFLLAEYEPMLAKPKPYGAVRNPRSSGRRKN